MRVKWTRQAVNSLQAVLDFCATHSLRRQQLARAAVFFKIQLLEDYPLMGPVDPLLAQWQPGVRYRFVLAGFYKIIYRVEVETDTVWICRVMDSRSDPNRLSTVIST